MLKWSYILLKKLHVSLCLYLEKVYIILDWIVLSSYTQLYTSFAAIQICTTTCLFNIVIKLAVIYKYLTLRGRSIYEQRVNNGIFFSSYPAGYNLEKKNSFEGKFDI